LSYNQLRSVIKINDSAPGKLVTTFTKFKATIDFFPEVVYTSYMRKGVAPYAGRKHNRTPKERLGKADADELLRKINVLPPNTDHIIFAKEQRRVRNHMSESYHSFVYNR
jgi:hypothetical protein